MSDHNNIYNIMSKLDALKPEPETPKQAAERIYESVEAKGSILEGVKTVEQNLSEKYMGFKEERETLQTKKGTIYKGGTYGTEYDPSDEEKKTKAKHVPKKGQKGRPKKDAAPTYSKTNDPFGRVPDTAPKGKKGTVIKGKGNQDTVDEANIQPTGAMSRSHIGNLSNPVTNSVVHPSSGKEIGLITQQPTGEYYAHPSSTGLAHSQGATFATKDEAHQFIRNAHAKAIKNGTLSDKWQKKQPLPQFAKGQQGVAEAAKWRDPEHKDKLYTQEPRSDEDDYYGDLDYYNPKPDDYPGAKNLKGGGEFDHNDPLRKGFGRRGHDVLDRGPRKGMPSRNHITSLKGSIKAAHGKHAAPVLPESRKTVSAMVLESVNFKKMMDECDMTMAEMLECIDQDIKTYKTTGDMTDRLRDFMHLHQHAKKQMEENKPVPYEVPAVQRRAAGAAPLTPSDVQAQDAARSMHPGMTKLDAPAPAVNDELDELAKLAGITDEGNAFTGKLASTPKGGEFELDGNTFKDTSNLDESMCNECGMYESQCSCQEGNLFTKHLKDTPDGGEFEIDGKKYKDTSSLEEMARLAGIFQEGKDYGDTTYNEPPTYDNTPDEQVQDEDVLLRGGDGEVAGMEKKMSRDGAARFSDNPLAMKESQELIKPAAEFDFVEAMGRKLMQAYEGIKAK